MSEMVERVSNAVRTELRNQGVIWEDDDYTPSVLMMQTGAAADMNGLVRAAIEAMREPTEEMVTLGSRQLVYGEPMPHDAEDVWRSMIDAALENSHA